MTTVGRIHLVLVPTTDPDRSIAFYESLGFAKRADFPYGDGSRWIELFPPDGVCGIALSGVSDVVGVDTGLLITVADIATAHAEQAALGRSPSPLATPGSGVTVQLGGATVTGPTPSMFHLRDPDGNRFLIIGD